VLKIPDQEQTTLLRGRRQTLQVAQLGVNR
jgi:hypothetical protein